MMPFQIWKKTVISASIIFTVCYAGASSAHGGEATLDPDGNVRNFTGLALITCFNDGNGAADNLIARIKDESPPVPNLLVNLQIYKGNKANSITDTVSGDNDWSPFITLQAGTGVYWLIVNKTDVGARQFELEWHCNTRDGVHTGTEISVPQFGVPAASF